MTNSERFIEAHKTAKQIRDCFSSYRDAFAFARMEIYAMEKTQSTDIALATAAARAAKTVCDFDCIYTGNKIREDYREALRAAETDALEAAFPGDLRTCDRMPYVQSQIDAYLA